MINALWAASLLIVTVGAPLITPVVAAANLAQPPNIISRSKPPEVSPAPPHSSAEDYRPARARANYEALMRGDLSVMDLSAQDLQDVIDLDRVLRGEQANGRAPEQSCIDREVRQAGGRPSQLAQQVIALKCRRIGGGISR